MNDGKIKIWCNGNPRETKIGVVDSDGKETGLLVEGIEFSMSAEMQATGWLKLRCCYSNAIELEIPADGSIVTRLTEAAGEERTMRELRAAAGSGAPSTRRCAGPMTWRSS